LIVLDESRFHQSARSNFEKSREAVDDAQYSKNGRSAAQNDADVCPHTEHVSVSCRTSLA
jgi:hypothetical protein